jgi:hypothetical protein
MNEKDFSQIPAEACTLTVGEFELGDNGKGAKSAPIKLIARSGGAIEHSFWGRVVHDLAGMHLHKSRLAIDYVHDSKEIIGYLNKFETDSGVLVTTGALVPWKDNDRATEILHKLSEGVPYEASINFGGDGIKIQELFEGETTEVNGRTFDGPGVIIREWPLRGVAICPYGADANTDSSVFAGNNAKTYTATVFTEPEAKTKELDMSKESVEVVASVEETEAVELEQVVEETVEPVKAEESKEASAVELESVEAEVEEVVEKVVEDVVEQVADKVEEVIEDKVEEAKELSRAEFAKIADEFGDEVASKVMRDGGDYHTAMKLAYDVVKIERDELAEKLSASTSQAVGTALKSVDAPKNGKKESLFKTGK